MGITLVVRGEDHVSNTPRQLLILDALGLRAPAYGHIPLLVGVDGRPLSKREGATAVANLADKGYCREAVWNYLGRLGHHYESDSRLTAGELIRQFSVEHISRSPARYDTGQLDYWQRSVVHTAAHDELTAWLGGAMLENVPEPVCRYLDNIFVERLWRSVKYEEVYLKAYEGVSEAKAGLSTYLDFYNDERPHQSLEYQTPCQVFEAGNIPLDNASSELDEHEERRGADPQLVLV